MWQSAPDYPIRLDSGAGVELLFHLINRAGVLPCWLCLHSTDSAISANVSAIDIGSSCAYDRNTVVLCEAKFHVKTRWSTTKDPESSTCCLTCSTLDSALSAAFSVLNYRQCTVVFRKGVSLLDLGDLSTSVVKLIRLLI